MEQAVLHAKVQPKAGRNSIEVDAAGRLRIRVTAPREGGKANEAVVALLAKGLGIATSRVQIVRGWKARNKLLRVQGLTQEEVVARLSTD